MDKQQRYYYSGGPPAQNMPPRADFPPVQGQNMPPRADFPPVQGQNMPPRADFPPVQGQNMPPRADFAPVPPPGSWDVYPQAPGPGGSWARFPPPQPGGAPPMYPHFDPSRPPPGYCAPSPPPAPSPANLQANFQPGHDANRPGSQMPPGNMDLMGDTYHRSHFDHFPNSTPPQYQPGIQPNTHVVHHFSADQHHKPLGDLPGPSYDLCTPHNTVHMPDPDSIQRKQDEHWVSSFLHKRGKPPLSKTPPCLSSKLSLSDFREKMYGTVQMLSELSLLCQTLKTNLENENENVWTDSYSRALDLKNSLEDRLKDLTRPDRVDAVKKKLELVKKRRARICRKKAERQEEKKEQEAKAAEKEAAIYKHQMKKIQEMEEKKREQELKLAADAVLSEVRKKQADAKRMLDILKALEKLRKLRKEAASRKGLFPEKESDQVFEGHLLRLRTLIKKRTALYGAEEKALRVMLEGEQEEERKRDREKRQRKEREKLLQKKREIDCMLFGAELPPDHPLQLYQEYYTQAERSLPSLIQIRRDWDQFLVPVNHPEGSSIPQGWVLPDPPADDVWATALEK